MMDHIYEATVVISTMRHYQEPTALTALTLLLAEASLATLNKATMRPMIHCFQQQGEQQRGALLITTK